MIAINFVFREKVLVDGIGKVMSLCLLFFY